MPEEPPGNESARSNTTAAEIIFGLLFTVLVGTPICLALHLVFGTGELVTTYVYVALLFTCTAFAKQIAKFLHRKLKALIGRS